MTRARHKWSAPERESSELSIRTCARCGLLSLSYHDWRRNSHWKDWRAKDAPAVTLTTMPECVRKSEEMVSALA